MPLPVVGIKEIRETGENQTYLIDFDISKIEFQYKTMNDLLLFPENDPDVVEELARLQDWELDKDFNLKYDPEKKPKIPFPVPITIRNALTRYCDLNGLIS